MHYMKGILLTHHRCGWINTFTSVGTPDNNFVIKKGKIFSVQDNLLMERRENGDTRDDFTPRNNKRAIQLKT